MPEQEPTPKYLVSNIDEWLPEGLAHKPLWWQERIMGHYGKVYYAAQDNKPDLLNDGEWTDGSSLEIPALVREAAEALFHFGGQMVYFQGDEESVDLIDYILEHNQVSYPDIKVLLREMHPSDCHRNALTVWEADHDRYVIMTGWALSSEDGCWRPHSWLVDNVLEEAAIIETTFKRDRYFGAPIRGELWWLRCGGQCEHD
jgi:hypothetical protein